MTYHQSARTIKSPLSWSKLLPKRTRFHRCQMERSSLYPTNSKRWDTEPFSHRLSAAQVPHNCQRSLVASGSQIWGYRHERSTCDQACGRFVGGLSTFSCLRLFRLFRFFDFFDLPTAIAHSSPSTHLFSNQPSLVACYAPSDPPMPLFTSV